MSRIGKQPVALPQGVKGSVKDGAVLLEGPKGKLTFTPGTGVGVKFVDGKFAVELTGSDAQAKANWGSARAIINNMAQGVSKGWKRSLEMNGVGFGAKVAGQNLTLSVGFSHEVVVVLPKELKCTVTRNVIELEAADKQLVGLFASKIRKVQPPEPYLGKGIKYSEETVRRKAGKTGKK